MKEVELAYQKYIDYLDRVGAAPTRGQKAHLTRLWHELVTQCSRRDISVDKYMLSMAQP